MTIPFGETMMMNQLLALFSMPGYGELLVICIVGLLLFGRRLPEVGRSLGKTIVEFKKGIRGIEDDIDDSSKKPPSPPTPTSSPPPTAAPPPALRPPSEG